MLGNKMKKEFYSNMTCKKCLTRSSFSVFIIVFLGILNIPSVKSLDDNASVLETISIINWTSNKSGFDEVNLGVNSIDTSTTLIKTVSPFNNVLCSDNTSDTKLFKKSQEEKFIIVTLAIPLNLREKKYLLCVKKSGSAWATHVLSFQNIVTNVLKETEYFIKPTGSLNKIFSIYKRNKHISNIYKPTTDNQKAFKNILPSPEIKTFLPLTSENKTNYLTSTSILLKIANTYRDLKSESNNYENNIQYESIKYPVHRMERSIADDTYGTFKADPPFKNKAGLDDDQHDIKITGLRVEHSSHEVSLNEEGISLVLANSDVTIRIFGSGITENTVVCFTDVNGVFGGACLYPTTQPFRVESGSVTANSAKVKLTIPENGNSTFYLCAKKLKLSNSGNYTTDDIISDKSQFFHQGCETWLQLQSYTRLLPLWASITIILLCLSFSALFSGLNLGLMSMDRTDLKILCNTGTESERHYAKVIQPVRDHGNYLLCSILLGNVLVNSTFTILLDDLSSGLIAVIISTLAIVIFGEIIPQAACSRHGLAVGAKTILITKAVMVITFPLSYPTSKVLDIMLGEEIGNVYNRERLKELVNLTTDVNDLDKDEVNIISGALELRKKLVRDVMTHIEDVFMLDYEAVLDFETVSEIMKSGFSRIPVFEGSRSNIVTLLYIKDLAFVDPDDNTPLKTLCQFYQNPCNFVFEDVTLDVMFKQFKEGHKGHMAFAHRVNNEGEGDPFYETVGLITLEDVIEELIQAEIMDETDVFTDNRSKRRRLQRPNKTDFTLFAERQDNRTFRISPQLTLATFQYLSTTVDAFKPDLISESILRRLLKQDVVHHIKLKSKDRKADRSLLIYQQGKPVDYFVLILEGRVEVTVGRENLLFESGPFTYFGVQALLQTMGGESPCAMGSLQSINMDAVLRHTFVPDYSVRAVSDVIYVAIKRHLYLAAKRATLLERSQKYTVSPSDQNLDDEVEKLLHSLDEEDNNSTTDSMLEHKQRNGEKYPDKYKQNSNTESVQGPVSASPITQSTFNNKTANSPILNSGQGLSTLIESMSKVQNDTANSNEMSTLLKRSSSEKQ